MIKDGKFIGTVVYKGDAEKVSDKFTKQTLVIQEDGGEYPQSIAVDFMNQGIKYTENIEVLDKVAVEIKFSAKEYNGKYYTSNKGWNIKKIESNDLLF